MGSLDDSCQSSICSAFPLTRGAPVDLHLTSASKQSNAVCERDYGFQFQSGEQKRQERGGFMTNVYLSGGLPLFFFFFPNVPWKKMFHLGAGGEIFLIQMDGNFPPFST